MATRHALYQSYERKALLMAQAIARRAGRIDEVKDLEQEARLALWEVTARYDSGRGVEFEALAFPWVRGHLLHWLERRAWVLRLPRWMAPADRWGYLPTSLSGADAHGVTLEDQIGSTDAGYDRADLIADLKTYLRAYRPKRARFIAMLLCGLSSSEAGLRLGISQRTSGRWKRALGRHLAMPTRLAPVVAGQALL